MGFNGGSFTEINLCGVSELGERAFMACSKLSKLPCICVTNDGEKDGVKIIGKGCFENCSKLSGDVIDYLEESVVNSIGDEAFKGCSSLTGYFSGSIGKITSFGANVFQGTKVTKVTKINVGNDGVLVLDDNATEIKDGQFDGTTKFVKDDGTEITEIKIPDTVTKIGKNAFSGCTSITNVEIPDTVTEIGENAFRGCTKLSDVKLPDNNNFTKLPNYCFYGDGLLKNIELPNNITSIGDSGFYGCGLEKINLLHISSLGSRCFGACKLKEISWGSDLKEIPHACFESCKFEKLTIPDNIETIGACAFRLCRNIVSMTVGTGVTSIPVSFMDHSGSLKSITFKGEITSIGNDAFSGQTKLENIEISSWDKIKNIGKNAFKDCSSLKNEIELSYDCKYDEDTSFDGCGLIIRRKAKET